MSDSDNDLYDPAESSNAHAGHSLETRLTFASASAPASRSGDVPPPSLRPSVSKAPGGATTVTERATATVSPATTGLKSSLTSLDYLLRGVTGRVRSICLNPLGSTLCAGGEGGTVCMWDFTVALEGHAVKPTRTLTPFPNRISGFQPLVSVHSSCDGLYFVACQDGDSPVLIAANGKQLGYCAMGERGVVDVVRCKGHRAPVMCSAPSPTVAARFFTGSQDSTARMWDAASFERHSVYTVKHGSGQLLENVVVETVLPIVSLNNDKASLFATGGEDGLVQLWDTRQKYRPGGVLSTLDMYGGKDSAGSKTRVIDDGPFFEEKHIGGMVEPDPSSPMLCVRCGSTVRVVDLRKTGKTGVIEDACPPLTGLSFATDVTPLVSCTSALYSQSKPSFMTCTGRAGYQHIAGGQVVQFTYLDGGYQSTMVWGPGASTDDVLSVAIDVEHGQLFAGMQSGDIFGRVKKVGVDVVSKGSTVQTWFATRPEREGRVVGKKSRREDAGECDELHEMVF